MVKASDNVYPRLLISEGGSTSTPASGNVTVYAKANGLLYQKDDAGTETALGGAAGGSGWAYAADGRLTLTTAVPVTTADVAAATTLYYTPYVGDQIATYSGSAWATASFTEKSISLAGLTAGLPYDVFIVDSTLALELLAWTNGTTRATALVAQNGVLCKTGALTRRYLGTICIAATGQCEDSFAKRFVWNMYNRLPKPLYITDATANWTYATATWRQARASAANQIEMVCGLAQPGFRVTNQCRMGLTTSQYGIVGIGKNQTTANDGTNALIIAAATVTAEATVISEYNGIVPLGYTYFSANELAGGATVTFYGAGQLALAASIMG